MNPKRTKPTRIQQANAADEVFEPNGKTYIPNNIMNAKHHLTPMQHQKKMLADFNRPYTDDTIMPLGKHAGKKMCDVPASWLNWYWCELRNNNKEDQITQYVRRNLNHLKRYTPKHFWPPRFELS